MRHVWDNIPITGTPSKEALLVAGVDSPIVRGCYITGGKTLLRFVDCTNVLVEFCHLEFPEGPADPDGQLIQFIRSSGTIRWNTGTAGSKAEDLFSIYSDKVLPANYAVSIYGNALDGRGDSDSSTSICLDGPYPPPTDVYANTITRARCGVTVAGGKGHRIYSNKHRDCVTWFYKENLYKVKPLALEYDNIKF
jgi:hypothetical protein